MRLTEIEDSRTFERKARIRSDKLALAGELLCFMRRSNVVKLLAVALTILAVSSCLIGSARYHNRLIAEMKSKLSASEDRFQSRVAELEQRTKRDVSRLEQALAARHRISKRSPNAQQNSQDDAGVVFTRWGRMDCPRDGSSRLIYHGLAAGSHYSHTGGGSDNLCLHHNISYVKGRFVEGYQSSSYIYGMEYRDSAWINDLFDLTDTMQEALQYHTVPCALCLAVGRYGKVMIPGSTECPKGWLFEYGGYIMSSGHSDKHSSENICVDKQPQVIHGTQGAQSGRHLHMVETTCTSLLCEPVVAGREITCVVCTI